MILYNVYVQINNILHIGHDILHHVYENLNRPFLRVAHCDT